ncbi:MAG: T9SS type A sorting domain-containing protein, partial [Bacteroidetes bacterium]|nr:T9SS type A sorting domain-containing protein [Bacteroidota bacterium]
ITASQAGNANWLAASDVIQTLTVNKATQTITFGALPDKMSNDPNFQLTATGGGSTSPIVYTSSNTGVAVIVDALGTPDPNGSYVDIVGPGLTTITASQAGDANYLAATPVAQNQNVINANLLNQTITFNTPAPVTYGDPTFQLTATGGGSGNPVTFVSLTPSVATVGGANSDIVTIVAPGTAVIRASQAGNGSYNPAPDVDRNLVVNVKNLTVSNASVVTKPYDGTTAATITGATLNGTVGSDNVFIATFNGTFADPNANTGIAVTANLTLGGTEASRYSLTQPTGLTGTIDKATQTITFGALANKAVGDPNFNLTATAAPSGLPVTYTSSDPSVASVTSGGLVHIGVIGSATITASQAGNQNYFAATPVQQTQTVVAATPVSIFANTITDANPSATNPFTTGQTFNPNITVNGISRGTGILASSASNRFSASDWTLNASPDANDYFEFSLTPNVGYKIDFSSLVFSHQRSTQGPATYVLKSSADNYTASLGSGSTPTSAGTVTLPLALTNISANIKFRLYAYSATGTGGTYSVNDFIFSGNVSYAPPTGTYVVTNVSVCGGTNDGTITVTPTGVGPFTYSWTGVTGSGNPASTPFSAGNVSSLTGLPIGYYNVAITDANLNTGVITGIHVGYAFSVYVTNSGSISSACSNTGSIILYGNAGVLPYTYSIDGTNYQASNTFLNLAAGSYTGYVKDGAGCISTKSITVAAAPPIVVSPFVRNASSCSNDGSIEVYRSGGISPYTYSIDGTNYQTSNKFLNLAAGTYTVYVKDSKGCVASQSATVSQGAALGLTANKSNTSTCVNDGTIQLIATGGTPPYTYSIDGVNYQSSNMFTGLGANTYVTSVLDSKGCTGTVNVTINLNPITVTAYATPASSCEGTNGTIQLFRTGGVGPYTYSLDGNTYQSSNLFTGLIPGYYEGYVKDSKTCVGQLIDIYVGPECGQRMPMAKGNTGNTVKAAINNTVKVTAYPNPSASEFLLSLEGYSGKVSIVVTDMMGRQVYQTETSVKQFRLGNNFKPGLYNVQVIQGTEKKSIKIVKE